MVRYLTTIISWIHIGSILEQQSNNLGKKKWVNEKGERKKTKKKKKNPQNPENDIIHWSKKQMG